MRRTHFLTAALALVTSSASIAADPQTNPAPAADAPVAPASEPAPTAAPTEVAAPAQAQTRRSIELGPQGVDEQGRVGRLHTVSRGDTLWDISGAYLGTPWVWPSVWTDNRGIANPHRINPGDRIWITADEMRVVSDDEADAFLERLLEEPAAPDMDMAAEEMDAGDELAPETEVMPEEPLLAAAPDTTPAGRQITVSTRAAMGFVTAEQMEGASSIVDSPIERTFLVEGDRVYLETSFPILADGRVVIPTGSYVAGTITSSKRAGRVKGRSELYLRFDSLTLPNGVTRDFRARMGALDGRASETFDRTEGRIKGEGTKGQDAVKVATAAGAGTSVGVIAGSAAGRPIMGTAVGAAAGAAAGMVGVLLSRGQDVVLGRGTVVEMVLDRTLEFSDSDIDFSSAPAGRRSAITEEGPVRKRTNSIGMPGQRPPLGTP